MSVTRGLVLQAKFMAMPLQEGDRCVDSGCAEKEGSKGGSGEGQTFTVHRYGPAERMTTLP